MYIKIIGWPSAEQYRFKKHFIPHGAIKLSASKFNIKLLPERNYSENFNYLTKMLSCPSKIFRHLT